MNHDGFRYVTSKKHGTVRYFSCILRRTGGCKASLKVDDANNVVVIKPHNHLVERVDPIQEQIKSFRKRLCERASNETISLHNIYSEEAAKPEHQNVALVYSWPTANSTMHSARKRSNPRIPRTLTELGDMLIQYSEKYQCIYHIDNYRNHSEMFYRTTLDTEHGITVLFCSQSLANEASEGAEEICIDGTFKVVPTTPSCHQLLSIHLTVRNHSIPVVYALMSSRNKFMYVTILQYVKTNILPTVYPANILTDYEQALQGAITEVYPEAQVTGCWFHYAQAVFRKMRSVGYLDVTTQNLNAKKGFKMLLSLPLLPANRILEGLITIEQWCDDNNVDLQRLFEYIRRFWINRIGPNYISVFNCPRRTNNSIERFHKQLKSFIGEIHPNVWTFIGKLLKVNTNMFLNVIKLKRGERIARFSSVNYTINDRNIRTAQTALFENQISIMQFLNRASHFADTYDAGARAWPANVDEEVDFDNTADVDDIVPALVDQPNINLNQNNLQNDAQQLAPVELEPHLHDEYHIPEDEWEQDWLDVHEEVVIEPQNPWTPDGIDELPDENVQLGDQCTSCFVRRRLYILRCGHFICGYCAHYLYNIAIDIRQRCPVCQAIIIDQPILVVPIYLPNKWSESCNPNDKNQSCLDNYFNNIFKKKHQRCSTNSNIGN